MLGYSGWQDTTPLTAVVWSNWAKILPSFTGAGRSGDAGLYCLHGAGLDIGATRRVRPWWLPAATGPVGATVGQIGKIKGCRVIGVAGGAEKCRHAVEVLGFDQCLDHHADDFATQLQNACPNGIDVCYENVGKVFDAVLPLLNTSARVPVCGLVSGYNATGLPEEPDRFTAVNGTILKKRIRMQGFIIGGDYGHRIKEFGKRWGAGCRRVNHYREQVTDGLENAPEALIGLLEGKNFWQSRDSRRGRQ